MHYAPHVPTDPLAKVEASLERWDQYEKWCHLDRNTRLKRLAEFMVTECRKHNFPYETFTS
jgi:hypothetical protein